jgi:hypothetical protein
MMQIRLLHVHIMGQTCHSIDPSRPALYLEGLEPFLILNQLLDVTIGG